MAVNGEKFWARKERRYKRYVVIPDVGISEVYCNGFQIIQPGLHARIAFHCFQIGADRSCRGSLYTPK